MQKKDFKGMKIIDFEKKGNLVRFYLGDVNDNDYHGDVWDACPYEHNAGTVYSKFVKDILDIAFPFNCTVLEPADDWHNNGNSHYSKNDMKARKVPCLVIKPNADSYLDDCFGNVSADKSAYAFYFGDKILNYDGESLNILQEIKMNIKLV